jgi:hypothetical protein
MSEWSVVHDAEEVLAFLEDVNDEEGRGIVDPITLQRMVRVVTALGGVSRKAARDSNPKARGALYLERSRSGWAEEG